MESLPLEPAIHELQQFVGQENPFRKMLFLIAAIVISYILSKYLGMAIVRVAQYIALKSDTAPSEEKQFKLRQVETYLSIGIAIVRAIVVTIATYITFQVLSPVENPSGIAAIGAGTFFIVFAGQTIGMLLRDVTAGTLMISENWFNVGDFIKVEPFMDLSGVVERFTLRSTKIRNLRGEVIWVHNQQMAAVHVTPRGVRTTAVDLFTSDKDRARLELDKLTKAIPAGATMLAKPLSIVREEQWGEGIWRITITGQTTPGREWLIDQFFLNAVKQIDEGRTKDERLFIYEPIARFADPVADRKFKRAVRVKQDSQAAL